jgi:hypothetical protein
LHRANANLVLFLLLVGCAGNRQPAALGWSLGGEAHVFLPGTRFARDFYRELTGSSRLSDSLARRPLVAVEIRRGRSATVLSANGAAPGRLTLARFHAPGTCGYSDIVTEFVLAFPPGGTAGRSTPPSHVPVVALVGATPFAGGAGTASPSLPRAKGVQVVQRVAEQAAGTTLLRPLVLDPDRSADAGEVVPLTGQRYAVGFRARVLSESGDTLLVTGVAVTDSAARDPQWVVGPRKASLERGVMAGAGATAVRYSLRGTVAGPGGGSLLLLNEIADVSARDSRATAVDPVNRRVIAAQPLALRCP